MCVSWAFANNNAYAYDEQKKEKYIYLKKYLKARRTNFYSVRICGGQGSLKD